MTSHRIHWTRSISRIVLCLLLALSAISIHAQNESEQAIAWSELEPSEQRLLTPFANQWDSLSPRTQGELRRGAARWIGMSPEQRRDAQGRFAQWQKLPEERRSRIRQRFDQFRQLPPETQRRLRRTFRHFRNLPPERRMELLERFREMSPEERRAFELGVRANERNRGAGHRQTAKNRGLLASLPAPMRRDVARMIRTLNEEQRLALREQVTALQGDERVEYLRELLTLSAEERSARLLGDSE